MSQRITQVLPPAVMVAAAGALLVANRWLTAGTVLAVGLLVVIATVEAVAGSRLQAPAGWLLSAAGVFAVAASFGLAALEPFDGPMPAAHVAARLGGQLAVVAGLLLVGRRKRVNRDLQGSVDAMVVAVGGFTIAWQLAAGVLASSEPAVSATAATLSVGLPLAALLGVAAVARIVFATPRPPRAANRLLAGAVMVAVGATVSTLRLPPSNPLAGDVPLTLLLAGWGLWASAMLDRTLSALSEPAAPSPAGLPLGRFVALGVAQSAGGIAVGINRLLGRGVDLLALVITTTLCGLLVLTRVAALVSDLHRARLATRARDRWYRQLVRHSADMLFIIDRDHCLRFASPALEAALGVTPAAMLGRSLLEAVEEADIPALVQVLDGLADEHNADTFAEVQVRLVRGDGARRWVELSLSDRLDDPAVRGIIVNARDVTAKKLDEEEIAFAYDKQAAIAALGRAALAGTEMSGLAEVAVEEITRALSLDACELYRVVHAEGILLLEAARGPRRSEVGTLTVPIGPSSQAGYAMQLDQPVLSNDLASETRFDTTANAESAMASAVSVVVRGEALAYGVMTASARRGQAFDERDLAFLATIANELALALERRSAEEETRHQALHDALTGLPNRMMFLNRLRLASGRGMASVAEGTAPRRLLGVLFLDLDHFKVVNDSLGHDAGDQLLIQVAERLRSAMRPTDTVARFGGDEFVVLCEDLDSVQQATTIASRVRDSMDASFLLDGNDVHVSASIGIAVTGSASDPEELLRDADAAMYQAKEQGRARYAVFDFTMRDQAMARLQTESALHRALSENQLVVHFQPIVRLADHLPVGVEALVRWNHPEWGLLLPDRFVPIAEKTGLIDEVGMVVLREACGRVAGWQRELGDQLEVVSVNLSATQLNNPNLAARVAEVLDATGTTPTRLCLEITESAVMSDFDRSMRVLNELREIGVRIAVDDFGTGYSSLAYLRKLPVDVLKVDREFVRGLSIASEDRAIAHTVISLAHRLGLVAIAEGVEVGAQVHELLALGCDLAQGYYFGEAVPADALVWTRSAVTVS